MKAELERRLAALNAEIRRYPTPIARCDEQLGALIEERCGIFRSLSEIQEPAGACTPDAVWTNDGGSNAA